MAIGGKANVQRPGLLQLQAAASTAAFAVSTAQTETAEGCGRRCDAYLVLPDHLGGSRVCRWLRGEYHEADP